MWPFSSTKKDEETGIRNFGVVVEGRIFRGADCGTDEFCRLRDLYGVTVRLCLFDDAERAGRDRREAERAGLRWIWIPMSDTKEPSEGEVRAALEVLLSGEKVFVSCKGGRHRTGLICACLLVMIGWLKECAWAENKKYDWYDRRWPAPSHKALRLWFFEKFKPENFK